MFMPRTQTPPLREATLVSFSPRHKCLGENESDGWRGICREVCERVFLRACVWHGADPASAPHPTNGNSRSEVVLIFTLSNPIM